MPKGKMYEFRISKYNNDHRKNGAFLRDEWTSFSDIGKPFNGKKLNYSEYAYTENLYLSLIEKICSLLNVSQMQITELEDYSNICPYSNGRIVDSINEIVKVAQDCLREQYWCKLHSEILSFHFGYDYYLYVCSPLDAQHISNLVLDIGLFVENKKSPYNKNN